MKYETSNYLKMITFRSTDGWEREQKREEERLRQVVRDRDQREKDRVMRRIEEEERRRRAKEEEAERLRQA